MKTPTTHEYFTALQEILQLQASVLTKVLPHSGERGSNDEENFKAFLSRFLPNRYSIGTGFMICSNPKLAPSQQTDIIIFDEFDNSPLFRELAATVFPIEIVYAAIEVKRVLQSKDLTKSVEAIAQIRNLAEKKQYVEYGSADIAPDRSVVVRRLISGGTAPRTYVVAYDTEYASIESFSQAWTSALDSHLDANGKPDAHLHGCVVLSKNWCISQIPHQSSATFAFATTHALARFLTKLLTDIASFPMSLANMNEYFKLADVPSSQR